MGCAGCDKPVLVRGNGPAIADAVRNLIENAVTYAPVGDEVKVTVDTEGKLSVSDHGPGIPVLDREHAFERFWRGKSSGGEGAGLGLAITREIMRIHEFTVARCASTTMSVAAPSLPSIFKSGPATWKNSENLPSTKLSPPRCVILFAQPAGLVEWRCDSLEVCALQQGDERHRTAFLDVRHHAHCPKTRVRLNNLGRCRQQG